MSNDTFDSVNDGVEETKKHAGGRPTKYDEKYALQAKKLCELGATDKELADFFQVHVDTINQWKITHQEFSDSLKLGKGAPDQRVKRALYQRALGYTVIEQEAKVVGGSVQIIETEKFIPPDPTSMIFWLKNRMPDEFRATPQPDEDDTPTPVEVHVHVKDGRKRDESDT